MTPLLQGNMVWLTPPQLAVQFNKNHTTIYRWCTSGFILTLGYKLRQDHKRRYYIGIPREQYIAMIADSIDSPSL